MRLVELGERGRRIDARAVGVRDRRGLLDAADQSRAPLRVRADEADRPAARARRARERVQSHELRPQDLRLARPDLRRDAGTLAASRRAARSAGSQRGVVGREVDPQRRARLDDPRRRGPVGLDPDRAGRHPAGTEPLAQQRHVVEAVEQRHDEAGLGSRFARAPRPARSPWSRRSARRPAASSTGTARGRATKSPSRTLRTSMPCASISAAVDSRATTVTCSPARASAAAMKPPTPPGPEHRDRGHGPEAYHRNNATRLRRYILARSVRRPTSASAPARGRTRSSRAIRSAGELGVAVQSHWFSVGPIVPWARSGCRRGRDPGERRGLLRAARARAARARGRTRSRRSSQLLSEDPGAAGRQVAVVDAHGRVAAHTGASCIAFAGHVTGGRRLLPGQHHGQRRPCGRRCSRRTSRPDGSLTARGCSRRSTPPSREGGDIRGRQSAAILVVPAAGKRGRRSSACASRITPTRWRSCGGSCRLHDAYELAGRADELVNEGRHEEAARCTGRRASWRRTTTSSASGPGSEPPRPATSRPPCATCARRSRCSRAGASCCRGCPPTSRPRRRPCSPRSRNECA